MKAYIRIAMGIAVAVCLALPLAGSAVGLAWDLLHLGAPKDDPTFVPVLVGLAVLVPLTWVGAWTLIAGGRRALPESEDGRGFWERLGDATPAIFGKAWSINGIGLRYLDFHDRRESDGTYSATLWIILTFLPVAPIRCERVRTEGSERSFGLPFFFWGTSARVIPVERLPMRRSRRARVLAFYYLLFLPLSVGPVIGGFAYVIARHGAVSAAMFWLGALAVLVWGVLVVAYERATMGRPA